VALAHTDWELTRTLGLLEDILLQLQPLDPDDEAVPAGLGPDELHALQRTNTRIYAAEDTPAPRLYSPDDGFEYPPLRFVTLPAHDLAAIGQAIAALSADHEATRYVLGVSCGDRQQPSDLVDQFARAHQQLALAPDHDTGYLRDTLPGNADKAVLTADQEHAYHRLTNRILAAGPADPLERFIHRGTAAWDRPGL